MTFDIFSKRLKIIKHDYNEQETKMNTVLDSLKILYDDLTGVHQDWLSRIIDNHLATLFMCVNPKLTEEQALKEVDYYVWENDFDGEVTSDGKTYHLDNDKELYEYILSL